MKSERETRNDLLDEIINRIKATPCSVPQPGRKFERFINSENFVEYLKSLKW